ncbi:hypothetical protein [Paludisphaera soli]|uniref:hypothetical protein n=1 Tax=Paludisphaera soli TaxID=2712865 RepID=UPI0013EA1E59|nr:hypothetical protein [Paludisphaera soli]
MTPLLTRRIAFAGAETRSFQRAAIVMDQVGGQSVSAKTIERVVHDVGSELAARRDADDGLVRRPASPPELAVVECDGGRIRTREPGRGPGVHRTGSGWSETKNACLIRAVGTTFDDAPQPEPPACFHDPKHVAAIAETEAPPTTTPPPERALRPAVIARKVSQCTKTPAGTRAFEAWTSVVQTLSRTHKGPELLQALVLAAQPTALHPS